MLHKPLCGFGISRHQHNPPNPLSSESHPATPCKACRSHVGTCRFAGMTCASYLAAVQVRSLERAVRQEGASSARDGHWHVVAQPRTSDICRVLPGDGCGCRGKGREGRNASAPCTSFACMHAESRIQQHQLIHHAEQHCCWQGTRHDSQAGKHGGCNSQGTMWRRVLRTVMSGELSPLPRDGRGLAVCGGKQKAALYVICMSPSQQEVAIKQVWWLVSTRLAAA
jgi:hypothetical protein